LDLAANAASLGAWAIRVKTRQDLVNALSEARGIDRSSVVVIETTRKQDAKSGISFSSVNETKDPKALAANLAE